MLEKEGNAKKRRLVVEENTERELLERCELVQDKQNYKYGDGMAWIRGPMIGRGSFGSVYLATLKKPKSCYSSYPSVMAVKSAEVSVSGSIQKEKEVLNNVGGCSDVIKCFGEETTNGENREMVYNLLLEYGSGGTLADMIEKKSGCDIGLPEFDVRWYTRSILRGLRHIHDCGYVHCDLKPENILLVDTNTGFKAKIGDLGLAKRANIQGKKKRKLDPYLRGTPMYLSPEAVIESVQEPPSDIWAIGCIVLEMLTGKPPWNSKHESSDATDILSQIGEGNELPHIPSTISKEGRSFLKGCFTRNPMYRLTAEMLLNDPFLEGLVDDDADKVEKLDVNAISTLLVLSETEEGDDEFSLSSFSDEWSYLSDDEELSSWSEEGDGDDDVENQVESAFSEEQTLQVQENTDDTLNGVQQYPMKFTISAGV